MLRRASGLPHLAGGRCSCYPCLPVQLSDQLPDSGRRLFRGRSYIPLILLPLFALTFLTTDTLRATSSWWKAVSVAVSLAGLAIRVYVTGSAPAGTSERSTTSIRARTLNVRGAYSLVRHPLYVANTLVALGLSMRSPLWLFPVVVLLLHVIYFERIAMAEERFLREEFGRAFDDWTARVRAAIPSALGAFQAAPFAWRRAVTELHALMVIGAGFFVAEVLEDSLRSGALTIGIPARTLLGATAVPFLLYVVVKRLGRGRAAPVNQT